jgi:hypothetical protein
MEVNNGLANKIIVHETDKARVVDITALVLF